jgi:hypothetical protein
MNHFKDEEEDFEKTKLLCRFLNPAGAEALFDKKTVDVTVSTESTLFDQMSKDLKGKYTPEQLEAIMKDPKHFSELDVIEQA